MSIRVLVAEDAPVVRRVVASLLKSDPEILLVGEAESIGEVMELASRLKPEVIVLDLHMGEGVPPTAVQSQLVGVRLLTMCLWDDAQSQALSRSFGAIKLLNKATLAVDLIPAIKNATSQTPMSLDPRGRVFG